MVEQTGLARLFYIFIWRGSWMLSISNLYPRIFNPLHWPAFLLFLEDLKGIEPFRQESNSCMLAVTSQVSYSTQDSNLDFKDFKSFASTVWASGALYKERDSNSQSPDPKSGAFTIFAIPAYCWGIGAWAQDSRVKSTVLYQLSYISLCTP